MTGPVSIPAELLESSSHIERNMGITTRIDRTMHDYVQNLLYIYIHIKITIYIYIHDYNMSITVYNVYMESMGWSLFQNGKAPNGCRLLRRRGAAAVQPWVRENDALRCPQLWMDNPLTKCSFIAGRIIHKWWKTIFDFSDFREYYAGFKGF